MYRQSAIKRSCSWIADFTRDQEDFLIYLCLLLAEDPNIFSTQPTTELSRMEVILGAKGEVGGGIRMAGR